MELDVKHKIGDANSIVERCRIGILDKMFEYDYNRVVDEIEAIVRVVNNGFLDPLAKFATAIHDAKTNNAEAIMMAES